MEQMLLYRVDEAGNEHVQGKMRGMSTLMKLVIVLCCAWGSGVMAAEVVPDSEQVLEHLRAANQARHSEASVRQQWELEQQRLALLIAEAQRQDQQLQQQMAADQAAISALQQRLAGFESQASQAAALDAVLFDLATEIDAALDERAARLPSGSIAAANTGTGSVEEPAMRFLRSAARLEQALQTGQRWRAGLSSGLLNGQHLAYEQLSLGHVCAWWLSRDGQRGGTVQRQNARNILTEITDTETIEQIRTALAIIHGDRAPAVVILPIKEADRTQPASEQER